MKTLYFIPFLVVSFSSHAQNTKKIKADDSKIINVNSNVKENKWGNEIIYSSTDLQLQPQFPGGKEAFNKFITSKFRVPDIKGGPKILKIHAAFTIEKDGSISNIKTLNNPGYELNNEVERVLKLSPIWKPGEKNGQKVRSGYYIPFTIHVP